MSKGKTTTGTTVDPQQMQIFKNLYDEGKSLYNTPFQPFTGQGVAGFTDDQMFIQDQARDMYDKSFGFDPRSKLNQLGEQGPISIQRNDIRDVKPMSLLDADIGAYQNPFTEQVIDNTLDDLNDARLMQLQRDQDAAIGRGAFGGSRSALLEAETNKNFFDQAGDITSKLRSQGFDRATNLAGQDIGRQYDADRFMAGLDRDVAFQNPMLDMQNRSFQANLFGNQLADQYQNFGLLSGIGNQQQGLNQAGLDFGYNEFLRGYDDPFKRFSLLTGAASGMPVSSTTTSQKKTGLGDVLGTGAELWALKTIMSDERLKENIKPIGISENGHNVYTWDWNDKAKELGVNDPTIGVIAQEVKKYMPEAVIKNDNGYYMVNYGAL